MVDAGGGGGAIDVATGFCICSAAARPGFGILRNENTLRPFNISAVADADGHSFRAAAVVPSSCNFRLSFRRNSSNFLLMRRPQVNTMFK